LFYQATLLFNITDMQTTDTV